MNTKRKTFFRFVFVTLTILTTAFCSTLWAQDCVPNDVALNTQVEVDNFQTSHGPCDRLLHLYIQGADITNLDGLSSLVTVDGDLGIQDNAVLTNVDGLSALKSVGAELTISNNTVLSDLDGLSTLQWVRSLWVFGNSTLANCLGLVTLIDRIDDYDPGPGHQKSQHPDVEWDADFRSNLPRCNSFTEILVDASLTEIPNCTPWKIYLGTQAEIDNFQASHGPCDRVGMLEITGEDIVNLDGLSALTKVGALYIGYNPQLTLVNGLQALTSADAFLVITGNQRLGTLDGLSGITSVGDNLLIITNDSLINVDGLSGLTSVGGILSVKINAVLDNLDGLSKVTNVRGLDISLNGRLRDLDGLSGITHVGGDLQIYGSDTFTNLDGLSSIVSVGGDLYILVNPALANCSALSKLLDQWDDGEPGPGPGIAGIPDVGGDVTVENNSSSCNSVELILDHIFGNGFEK